MERPTWQELRPLVEGLSQPAVVQRRGSGRINTPSSPSYFLPVSCQGLHCSVDATHQDETLRGTEQMPQGGTEVWTGKGKFPGTLALNWNCGAAFAPLGLEIQRQIEFGDVSDGDLFLGLRSGIAGSRLDLCWPSLELRTPFCSSTLCMGALN